MTLKRRPPSRAADTVGRIDDQIPATCSPQITSFIANVRRPLFVLLGEPSRCWRPEGVCWVADATSGGDQVKLLACYIFIAYPTTTTFPLSHTTSVHYSGLHVAFHSLLSLFSHRCSFCARGQSAFSSSLHTTTYLFRAGRELDNSSQEHLQCGVHQLDNFGDEVRSCFAGHRQVQNARDNGFFRR